MRKSGVELIAEERIRQISEEGYNDLHDDEVNENEELAMAAATYAMPESEEDGRLPLTWPWDESSWKPSRDRVRELVKAGALIAAEIDRLNRISQRKG